MKNTLRHTLTACCLVLALALMLAGCASTKRQLGLVPTPPDEFTVVHRAPLSMPPDYDLRPPQPGAPRPQDEITAQEAQTAVFGEHAANAAAPNSPRARGAADILQATGAEQADPDIRAKVDRETTLTPQANQPVAKKLMNMAGIGNSNPQPAAEVVDPQAELTRMKTDQAQGKPVTAGPTPSQPDQ